MATPVKLAIVYYSSTGTITELAKELHDAGVKAGAEVRLLKVAELAPQAAIDSNPAWAANHAATAGIPEASPEDIEWADAVVFGTPTRFGNVSSQLKQFIDRTGKLWQAGNFHNKPATSFTSAMNRHGGQESTILPLNNVLYHWGCIIVPPGYTDPLIYAAGGNPYGTSWASGGGETPEEATLEAARYQGRHLADIAERLR